MRDISDDNILEIFIGQKTNQDIRITEVYSCDKENKKIIKLSSLNDGDGEKENIYICSNNMILERIKDGGELINVSGCKRMGFAAVHMAEDSLHIV